MMGIAGKGAITSKDKSGKEGGVFWNNAQFRNGNQRKHAEESWGSDLAWKTERKVGQVSKYCPLGPGQGA